MENSTTVKTQNIKVTLIDSDLQQCPKNSLTLTGKYKSIMLGKVKFNDMEVPFTCRYETATLYDIGTSELSKERLSEIKNIHYNVLRLNEDQDKNAEYEYFEFNLTGFDNKMLNIMSVTLNIDEVVVEFKALRNEDEIEYKKLFKASKEKEWNESWYALNLKEILASVPDGVSIEISPTFEKYSDPDNNYSSHTNISYDITMKHGGETQNFSLESKYSQTGHHSRSSFSGFGLKKGYDYSGLFTTIKGFIKRMNKEWELLGKIDSQNKKEELDEDTELKLVRSALDCTNIQLMKERQYSNPRQGNRIYLTTHYEIVFNHTKSERYPDNENNEIMDHLGSGIQFKPRFDKDNVLIGFRISKIEFIFHNKEESVKFVSVIVNNTIGDRIMLNLLNNTINVEGMKKILLIIQESEPSKICEYTWKSIN